MASYTHWRESFYGSAWVALDNLSPEDGPQKSLDSKKILKLCRIFALEGCRPDDEGNRLRSVVSRTQLNALREAGLVRKSKALPLLNLTFKVNYVHGRHRIAAAEAFLSEGNQQWVVDFHLEETGRSPSTRLCSLEAHVSCASFTTISSSTQDQSPGCLREHPAL